MRSNTRRSAAFASLGEDVAPAVNPSVPATNSVSDTNPAPGLDYIIRDDGQDPNSNPFLPGEDEPDAAVPPAASSNRRSRSKSSKRTKAAIDGSAKKSRKSKAAPPPIDPEESFSDIGDYEDEDYDFSGPPAPDAYKAQAKYALDEPPGPYSTLSKASQGLFQSVDQVALFPTQDSFLVALKPMTAGPQFGMSHAKDLILLMEIHRLVNSSVTFKGPAHVEVYSEKGSYNSAIWDSLPQYARDLFGSQGNLASWKIRTPALTARDLSPLLWILGPDYMLLKKWTGDSLSLSDNLIRRTLSNQLPNYFKHLPVWLLPNSLTQSLMFEYVTHLSSTDTAPTTFWGSNLQLFHTARFDSPGSVDPIPTFNDLAQALSNWAYFCDFFEVHHKRLSGVIPDFRFTKLISAWKSRLVDTQSDNAWPGRLAVTSVLHVLSARIVGLSEKLKEEFNPDADREEFFNNIDKEFSRDVLDEVAMLTRLSISVSSVPQFSYSRTPKVLKAMSPPPPPKLQNSTVDKQPSLPLAPKQQPAQPRLVTAKTICIVDLAKSWLSLGGGCRHKEKTGLPCPREHLQSLPLADVPCPPALLARIRDGLSKFKADNPIRIELEARLGSLPSI